MELVDCFNMKDNTMRTTLGTIKLDAPKVGHALELNARGDTFENKIDNNQFNDEQKAAVKSFKGATSKTLKKIVIKTKPDSEENTMKFKRAFILYVQKIFFFLVDGITEMRRKNLKGVEGRVFALLIIYMHETHFGKDSEDEKAQPPWGLLCQTNQRKETTKKKKTSELKKVQTPLKIGKREALASKLGKFLQIEDDPKGKKKLGKRKHVEDDESEDESEDVFSESESEDDSSEFESEGDSSESESEGGSESKPDLEKTISEDENLGKRQRRTRIPLQPSRNEELNAAAATQPRVAVVIQPPQSSELNVDAATDVDPAPAAVDPPHQHAAAEIHEDVPVNPKECRKEVVKAMTAEEELIGIDLSKSITNEDVALVGAPIHEDVQVTPQYCGIEVVQATSIEEEIIRMEELSKSNANVDAQIHEDVLVTPQDCGIEVVEATSAEEELISKELSNNITNLVVETQVEKVVIDQQDLGTQELTLKDWFSKSDPKVDIPTDKEVEEQINRCIMMVAEMALAHSKPGPLASFKLCPEIGSQPEEQDREPEQDAQKLKGKEIQHEVPDSMTPEPVIQKRKTITTRLYNWATKTTENNDYEHLFNFKTGKEYAAMRYHFLSLGKEDELEMTGSMLARYDHNYINSNTGLSQDISTMTNMDPLHYIDENKMKSAPFLFAPVLYENHWWLYVLDVENRKFYALDSLNRKSPGGDRNKLGRFAMRVHAGATTLFPNMTKNVGSHSFLAKYIPVPRQPNAHDCGIYVLKYMDIVNPSLLGKRNFTVPVWTEAELQQFREQYTERILYHSDNYFRFKTIKASNSVTRKVKPSTALQSPYT
ncbi:hypothetical protein PIB30_000014 [Stylosanthes scabra]|uniref:Ubiquitin-like protease family profile domain-containing protein n=1 Tax=Stylosanthes scabra TaxID=79078 RepID=A0ABU6Q1T8_9FABA|nr:hypothetical protein [Stylosanthes scabra]